MSFLSMISPPRRPAVALFRRTFGDPPTAAASAPGRVNLIGEHLDYNGGPVLPVALNRRTIVVAGPASAWHFVSAVDETAVRREIDAPMQGHWSDYLVGVVRALRVLGLPLAGGRVAVATSVPIGAGLSSSAALTVAAAKALSALAAPRLTAAQLADIAFQAEHDHVGVRCGRMDQTIAAFARTGTALFFDTQTGERIYVPLRQRLWVVETGRSHRLTGGELNERRRECEQALALLRATWPELETLAALRPEDLPAAEGRLPKVLFHRVRHVVTETARTRSAAGALTAGHAEILGQLLVEGHMSLRDDYVSSISEADLVVDVAMRSGAYGARLTGAGWGGAVLVLIPVALEQTVLEAITAAFRKAYDRTPAVWSSPAAGGVKREPIAG